MMSRAARQNPAYPAPAPYASPPTISAVVMLCEYLGRFSELELKSLGTQFATITDAVVVIFEWQTPQSRCRARRRDEG